MQIIEINKWDALARAGFTYQADGAATPEANRWRSYADDAIAGRPWAGNCDALGSTVLDLCTRAGIPLQDAYRLCVYASSDGSGHFVGCCSDQIGKMWIVGDTFRDAPYPVVEMHHKPDIYNRLSEQVWRKGVPWTMAPA